MVVAENDVLSTAPAIEPVTVEECRMHLDLDDAFHDTKLLQLVRVARVQVEHDARIALITQTRKMNFASLPATNFIKLNVQPVQSVTSVQYTDQSDATATVSASSYTVDTASKPALIVLNDNATWPSDRGHHGDVVVTYVAGYGSTIATVPETARLAILMLVAHWFASPSAISMAMSAPKEVPMGYRMLISQLSWGQYP